MVVKVINGDEEDGDSNDVTFITLDEPEEAKKLKKNGKTAGQDNIN
jgi:hypothetical protein